MSSQTFLILLLLPIAILSVYVSVRGSPVNSTSYVSKTFVNLAWDSCIRRCIIAANCILVHSNSLNNCYLYAVGDIIQVRNDQNGYSSMNDTVAFRMRNSPFECSNRSSDMLFGVINPYNRDNITSYEITMSPTNEYYEIKYDEGYTWSECVGRCHMSPICIAAYGNSSNYCLMYSQGDIIRVRNDWRGLTAAREKVAFKVTALTDECTDEASGMFEVETKWDSESMISYRVSTASDYYTIQYTHNATAVCGNWLDSDPNKHCLTCHQTMYRFRGTINAISQTSPITVNSWSGCLVACMLDINCFMVKYTSGLDCQLYEYGYVYSFKKVDDFTLSTPAEDLPFLGLKVIWVC